jgi:hypothetical protein
VVVLAEDFCLFPSRLPNACTPRSPHERHQHPQVSSKDACIMSVQRKHLVQRSRNPEQSSPAQGTRQHGSEAPVSMLPPYQPPSCPLTAHSQRQLNHLHVESGTQKYKKHISGALHALQNATADCHERVYVRKEQLEKLSKRKDQDEGLARKYTEREKQSNTLKRQVETITLEAENAVRDLVDYEDELAMQDTIMKDIIKDIREAPTVQPARRPRRVRLDDEASEEDEEEAPTDDPNILSPVELLKKAKEEYASQWGERSMKSRYISYRVLVVELVLIFRVLDTQKIMSIRNLSRAYIMLSMQQKVHRPCLIPGLGSQMRVARMEVLTDVEIIQPITLAIMTRNQMMMSRCLLLLQCLNVR